MEGTLMVAGLAFRTLLAASCLLPVATSSLSEEGSQEWNWCHRSESVDLTINGCTALIQSGRYTRDDLVRAFLARGIAYHERGDTVRAFQDFNEAIRLAPTFNQGFYERGRTYRLLGDTVRAIQDLDKAVQLDPTWSFGYGERGKAYRDSGDLARAIQDFDEALRLNPGDNFARYNRAILYRDNGDTPSAIQDFDEIINRQDELLRRHGNQAVFLYLRGLAKQGRGDAAGGAADIAAAKAIKDNVAERFWRLAR